MKRRKTGISRKAQTSKVYVRFFSVYLLGQKISNYCASQAVGHVGPQLARWGPDVWGGSRPRGSQLMGVPMCGSQTAHLCMGQRHCMALSLACVRK